MTRRILTAAVLLVLVLGAIFWLPFPLFLAVLCLVIALGTRELLQLLRSFGEQPYQCLYPLRVEGDTPPGSDGLVTMDLSVRLSSS